MKSILNMSAIRLIIPGDIKLKVFIVYSKRRQNFNLFLFVLPALLTYSVIKLYPAVSGMFYAMTNWNGINKAYDFIGISNFIELVSDIYFWQSVWFTCKYVAVMLIAANAAALGLAVVIESLSSPKVKGVFRTIFFMPNMISMIIGGYMWRFIFHRALYYMADNWGWKFLDQSWVGDPRYAFASIVVVASWGTVGYLMIIYIAALQGIPPELKESASMDGANSWQIFRNITIPMIRPAIAICIFWTLNSAFQVFDVVFSLTGGGPGRATQTVALNIYEEAFKGNIRYGYATAKSTVLFLIIFLITVVQLKIMKVWREEK
ncbi:MAG: sugar ABC transporter permease [Treponema sp.]|nr:sugar ABC transporter permease [Treponema sp.]